MTREPRLGLAHAGCSLWQQLHDCLLRPWCTRSYRVPAWIAASDDRVQGDAARGTALLATSSSEGENPALPTPGQDRSEGRRGDGERRAVF